MVRVELADKFNVENVFKENNRQPAFRLEKQ